jgi:1,4-alpha-glucan branching enzyme
VNDPVHTCAVSEGAIDAILDARHGDPFAVLGPHRIGDDRWEIRVLLPQALKVTVQAGSTTLPLTRIRDGFFCGNLSSRERPAYRLTVDDGAQQIEMDDAYRFGPSIGDADLDAVQGGGQRPLHDVLGAHPVDIDGIGGTRFAVWAPNARRVSVVGDFNGWDGRRHPMRHHPRSGVWELFVPRAAKGQRYKYELIGPDGRLLPLKSDPFAFQAEHPPATASVIAEVGAGPPAIVSHGGPHHRGPMSIYEVHLGSWARRPEEGGRSLTYRELADKLIPYVKDLGFTHIELLPITEFPFDGSWGYQPISLFAPTSRFGTPDDFRAFVDAAHKAGIGILLDWVPAHFPNDAHGLASFDGTHLYEHADPRQGFHQDWGTCIYNFGRCEVVAFLVENARFWVQTYGLDGLRVDAVASMLYLDYSRKAGEWVPNRFGGNENLEAIDFLRRMNETVYGSSPQAVTVAEESTAWPGVSKPVWAGGLGFGFKWNMGWMHDTLSYMARDPIYRRHHHHEITFGLLYAFSENFILPLSHDEVVHGKGSLIARMPGDRWQKFANLRAYFAFMWAHPGKKLLFMGGEFGQVREWNHDASLDWHLLDEDMHRGVQALVRDLNRAYVHRPALWELDSDPAGFGWIVGDDSANSVYVFQRRSADGRPLVAAVNFTPVVREGYRIGVPTCGRWREILNSDAAMYGGGNIGNMGAVQADQTASHGLPCSIELTLPPLGCIWLEPDE